MIYQSDKAAYAPVMEILKGNANDIFICRNVMSESESYYTLLVIHDHEIVRRLFCVMEGSAYGYACCTEIFQQGAVYCAVFPYVKERQLKSFYMPAQIPPETCGTICENLILSCMLSKLPYPLLYLVLEQEQLHLRKDYSVEAGYTIELDELDGKIGEKECAKLCASILRELLKPGKGRENMAYRLFMKKWDYATFVSLYRDMRLVKKTLRKQGILTGPRRLFRSRREDLFKVLQLLCLGMIFLALCCLFLRTVWGEVSILRILVNHFKVIGTQSLTG